MSTTVTFFVACSEQRDPITHTTAEGALDHHARKHRGECTDAKLVERTTTVAERVVSVR